MGNSPDKKLKTALKWISAAALFPLFIFIFLLLPNSPFGALGPLSSALSLLSQNFEIKEKQFLNSFEGTINYLEGKKNTLGTYPANLTGMSKNLKYKTLNEGKDFVLEVKYPEASYAKYYYCSRQSLAECSQESDRVTYVSKIGAWTKTEFDD